MTTIRVGMNNGKSKIIEINMPYDEIRANDLWAEGIHGITGWVDVEEEARQSRKQLHTQTNRIGELKVGCDKRINGLKSEIHKLWAERDEWRDEWIRSHGYIETINSVANENIELRKTIRELKSDRDKASDDAEYWAQECDERNITIKSKNAAIEFMNVELAAYRETVDEKDSLIKGLDTNITSITQDRNKWRQSATDAKKKFTRLIITDERR